ncbi:t-SNARE [Scheffersomyces xylosifermentans]|uniref:t-SNARE n=1 Tax=Scheffersomyces xylosifermentans TaxID=1304137 RepID=UPI00315C8827
MNMNKEYHTINSYEMGSQERSMSYDDEEFMSFMNEIQDIRSFLGQYSNLIDLIANKQETLVHELEYDEDADFSSKQVESLVTEVHSMQMDLKKRIKNVQTEAILSKDKIKIDQAEAVKVQFMESIQRYQRIESSKRQETKVQTERQYRLLKPDASEEEVKTVLESGADSQQYFQQALMQSNRSGEAKTVLTDVQARHREILRLEKTMAELTQLFADMEELVIDQDQDVQLISEHVNHAQVDIEQGVGHTYKAVDSAKSYRKKKMWLVLICILILLAIIGALAGYFASR